MTILCDYLRGTFKVELIDQVSAVLASLLGPGERRPRGLPIYVDGCFAWESGARVAWANARPEALVVVSGADLSRLTAGDQLWLMHQLRKLGVKLTRVDLASDDLTGEFFKLAEVHQAAELGNVVGFRRYKPERDTRMTPRGLETLGDTAYFGRRGKDGSGRYVRFYDKLLEQKEKGQEVPADVTSWVRLECEFSGEYAEFLGDQFWQCEDVAGLERLCRRVLAGCIDFKDRKSNHGGHVERMPRLAWWEKARTALTDQAVKYTPRRIIPPLHKTLLWFKRSCTRSLAKGVLIARREGHDLMAWIVGQVEAAIPSARGWRPGADAWGLDVVKLIESCNRPVTA